MNAALELGIPEDGTLEDYEQIIDDNLRAFVRVGIALRCIRDRRLYEAVIDQNGKPMTWTGYLQTRWHKLGSGDKGISRAHAGRMINGAEAYQLLAETFNDEQLPPNERAFRPFVTLDVPTEAKVALWEIMAQTAPAGVVDSKHIALVTGIMKEVVITGAIEDGDGGQIHVSQALKAAITTEVYERYKSERAYTDAVHTPALYNGRGVVTALEGSRVTLELEAAPDVSVGQTLKVYLNSHKERG
jgi:hypothetical protein